MTTIKISTPPRLGPKISLIDLGIYPRQDVSTWTRQSRWIGGCYDAFFTLAGDGIYDFFDTALGYDVTEFDGSASVWDGFIYEMILHTQVDRVRSYDGVYNHVAAFARNLLTNGGFESGGLTGWTAITSGSGSVAVVTSPVARGSYAVRCIAGTGSGRDTYIYQTVDVHEKTTYRLTFYYDDTLGPDVRYFIDSDIGIISDVQAVTASNGRYRRYSADFVTQPSATTVTIGLACPATNSTTSYFDDVRLERLVDEKPQNVVSPPKLNDESIATYGRKQEIMRSRFEYMAQAESTTQQFLDASAFPKTKRGAVSLDEAPSLDVYVRGYGETFNWNYWALQTGGASLSVDSVFAQIQSNNEFVSGYVINGSPPQVALQDSYTETQADILASVQAQIGTGYRVHMAPGGLLVCDVNDWQPRYYMRSGELYTTSASALAARDAANIRTIQPAIVRDLDFPMSGVEPESSYLDRRDFLMSNVEVDEDGVSFST